MKIIQFTLPVPKDYSVIVQEDIAPHFYPHLHRHAESQITWIIEGEGTLIAGNYMEEFKAGDIYVFGANQPHLFKNNPPYFEKESLKTVHALSIFFNFHDALKPLMEVPEMHFVKKFLETLVGGIKIGQDNVPVIAQKIEMVRDTKGAQRLAAFINLLHDLTHAESWIPLSSTPIDYKISEKEGLRMNEVYQYTMQHFKEEITLQTVADIAHLTPQAFCRYFKKRTGKTYINFLNEVRINEASKKLVDNQFENIAAIAYSCGFNNVTTFNRVFKQVRRIAPNQYLKQLRKKLE
jgi:AraC-like DNA-binding protein